MNFIAQITMFGWIPVVLYLFNRLPVRRAVIVSFITAWLFLPQASFPLHGLPDYTKMSATCYGILLATVIFDVQRFRSFRLSWLDLPMLIWCICPFASSITNDLGWYDGVSAMLEQTVIWGLPYFLGRIYLGDLKALHQLAIGIFAGGLIYVPLCLYEIRMSPQLHRMVYGEHAHSFAQTIRYGGYRPTVFMEHGLMVGAWMMAAALISVWLWQAGVVKQFWGIPIQLLVVTLLITSILVRSTGAWFLLAVGIVIMLSAKWLRTSLLVLILMAIISLYLYDGMSGTFSGNDIVSVVSEVINPDRAQSLGFRFDNETILSTKARERILFGWGGWGRNRVYDAWGNDISVTDSLWIIAFGINGAVGLLSITASLLLPVIRFLQIYPASVWLNRKVAPAAVLGVIVTLYMIDCLLNAMINPIFVLACGGIAGLVLQEKKTKKTTRNPMMLKPYLE